MRTDCDVSLFESPLESRVREIREHGLYGGRAETCRTNHKGK
jgi:hypothetical protein